MTDLRGWLRQQLRDCAYPGYVYGYPHKKAYRPLERPLSLNEVWASEDRRNLYCYVHFPFCNQRCSFCNLFTFVPGGDSPTATYLDALEREMESYAEALNPFSFSRFYLGGGTPTFLTTPELHRLVAALRSRLGVCPARVHGCVECSPETLDEEKVAALRELGFRRVSLGVQSFAPAELRAVNRRFDFARHDQVIRLIGRAGFPEFNLDLIYGLPGQTLTSWSQSLARAIDSPATSLFLYPLYVRPMTGLAARSSLDAPPSPTTREMATMYDHAVERLANAGFRQVTMRQFRRDRADDADEYRCARDGMVGLGAGARSYTDRLHYSTPWRMAARNIRGVVEQYEARMRAGDTSVSHGIALNEEERRRRWVILSLLHDGLDRAEFRRAFDRDPGELYADVWCALLDEGCVWEDGDAFRLTPRGVRHADVVGQLFFSTRVRDLMTTYEYDE